MEESKAIGASVATIYKIQTTIDGGARLTLDLPVDSVGLMSSLLKRKLENDELVMVAFVEVDNG